MNNDTRCTCRIVKGPTYDVYVQTPCGIHRGMLEREGERLADLVEVPIEGLLALADPSRDKHGIHRATINALRAAAKAIRESSAFRYRA